MFITLKMLLRTLVLPPAGPLLLAGAGLWLLARRRAGVGAARLAWALLIAGLLTLWLLATPVVADALTRLAERYPALDLSRPPDAQAIVILGGGEARVRAPEYGGPAAAFELLERVSYGAYLARRTPLPVLISGSPDEALAMQTVLWRDFGIRARWVDGSSRDTYDDAQFSARLLGRDAVRRIVLVTSARHEWRAAHEFMSAGLEVVPAPVHLLASHARGPLDYLPSALGLLRSNEALYELFGDLARQALALSHLRRHDAPPQ